MKSSVTPSASHSRRPVTCGRLKQIEFLESTTCDEYSVFQPLRSTRQHPLSLGTSPICTLAFLCIAFLVSGSVSLANDQVPLRIHLKTSERDGTTAVNSNINFQAEIKNETQESIAGKLQWSLCDAQQNLLLKFDQPKSLKVPADSTVTVSHKFQTPAAGFYYAKVTLDSGQQKYSQLFRFGSAPEAIKSERVPEQDFDKFWSQTRERLEKIEPHYLATKQIESKDKKLTLFEVEFHSFGNVRVSGWLEIPKTPGPHPCVLRLPGYGQKMKPLNKFDDLAVFSFNIRGHGNSQKDISGKPNNFWIRGLEDKDNYFYRGAYMDCVRAMQFLKNHPKIDPQKIAVWGGSQGGGLALATAAFDSAVAYCVADIPFLVDWDNYFQLTRWPEMDQWIESKDDQDWSSVLTTMSYFDVMFLAPKIECPVLSGIGLQDNVCPPTTIFCMLNRIKSPKKHVIYPERKHATGRQHPNLVWRTLRDHFQLND